MDGKMQLFAERLKSLRKGKKLTQVQMAEFMGCTEQHYQRIEYGKINVPMLDIAKLAEYFGVFVDYLLGMDFAVGGGYDLTENQQKLLDAMVRLDDDEVQVLLAVAQKLVPRPPGDPPGQP